jgi:hypothetical protein
VGQDKYGMRYRDIISENAPKGAKAARFIKKREAEFKKRYGDAWETVLYATANKLFKKKKPKTK